MRNHRDKAYHGPVEREIDAILEKFEDFTDACADFNVLMNRAQKVASPAYAQMWSTLGLQGQNDGGTDMLMEGMQQPFVRSRDLVCEGLRQGRLFLVQSRTLAQLHKM